MARPSSDTDRTIGQLVADATHDLQGIVRGEIALAKAEVTSGAKVMGKGAGMLAGAAFLAVMGILFLLNTLALVLAIWLPVSAAYGIVTAVLVIIAAVLAVLGKKALEGVNPAPERAIEQGQKTIAVLKGQPEVAEPAASTTSV